MTIISKIHNYTKLYVTYYITFKSNLGNKIVVRSDRQWNDAHTWVIMKYLYLKALPQVLQPHALLASRPHALYFIFLNARAR